MQEVLRLKRASTIILSHYSTEPNSAISLMENKLKVLEIDLEKQKSVTESLHNAFKNLPTAITSQPVTKPLQSFQTASKIKEIGKILPEERLEEPIGRHGKVML